VCRFALPSNAALSAAGLIALLAACNEQHFSSAEVLGGVSVPAERLNHGRQLYGRYCASCHGIKGDGQGSSSVGMSPAPRDFTRGRFKFTSSPDGGLPSDDDLARTVRRGLKGTHMPAWGKVSDHDLSDVVQYIKTFSGRWKTETPARPVPVSPDPWMGARAEAVARGEAVYHGVAQCWTCHPAYVPDRRIAELSRTDVGTDPLPWRSEPQDGREVTTEYGPERPPDFLREELKADADDADLYRTIAAGIGGTPMPSFHTRLPDKDLWSVVHYVRALQKDRGTPHAEAVRSAVKQQAGGSAGQGR
jgi:mono/diheme cytochrome c family protein